MKVYGTILINNIGEVLLVRGRLSHKWSFPKGHCKTRETDLECALRELYEETGLVMKEDYKSYHKLKGGGYFVFAVAGRPLEVCRDHREIEEIAWIPLSAIGDIHTNVDVSIFNTLMKNITVGKTVEEYIDSPEIKAKENSITRRIA
jgi:8-oxo-dGTP pyrophosphatase MutT (NUDIX family)